MPPKPKVSIAFQQEAARLAADKAGTSSNARPLVIVAPPKNKFLIISFDIDPNNGTAGYVNWITYLQRTEDFKTWTNIGLTCGSTNGFNVPITNRTYFYRICTPKWTAQN